MDSDGGCGLKKQKENTEMISDNDGCLGQDNNDKRIIFQIAV